MSINTKMGGGTRIHKNNNNIRTHVFFVNKFKKAKNKKKVFLHLKIEK